jgi:hypothetical protein
MISSLVSGIKKRYRKNLEKQTAQMDPVVRTHLVEVLEDTALEQEELGRLEQELHQARVQLSELETKQHFVETRLFAYRKQLQEAPLDVKEKNQPALDAVGTTHKQLLASIELFKRRIYAMEKERDLMQYKTEECQDFLTAAQKLQNATNQDEETGNATPDTGLERTEPLHTEEEKEELTTNPSTNTTITDDNEEEEEEVKELPGIEHGTEPTVLAMDEEQGLEEEVEETDESEEPNQVLTELEPEPAGEPETDGKADDDDDDDKAEEKD